jgi:hypothetical protein
MGNRLRCYIAGTLHAAALCWIVGWAVSRFDVGLSLFGPTGWLPVPLALPLVFAGVALLRPADKAPGGSIDPKAAKARRL